MNQPPSPPASPVSSWSIVETKVVRRVMVQVSMRKSEHDDVPLYSMRVGTAQLLNDGTTRISGHMSIYDIADAIPVLQALSEKYMDERTRQKEASKQGLARRYRQSPPR